jgi:hypothetical protein
MSETLPPSKDAYIVSSVEFPDDAAQGYKELFDAISYTEPEDNDTQTPQTDNN